MSVKVYSTPQCVQCKATYMALNSAGVAYEIIDIQKDAEAYDHVIALGHKQLPVVETDLESWSGFDPEKIQNIK